MLYDVIMGVAILSSVLYHVLIKPTPVNVHPVVSLIATYGTVTAR
jgi:hypothetical protein